MKYLNGAELAGFIKERQVKQVRALRQAHKIIPKLAIVLCNDNPVSAKYTELKKSYGADILIDVKIHKISQKDAITTINRLNKDKTIHGIIVQLPLNYPDQTDEIVSAISVAKDADGLNSKSHFDAATAMAILWLLSGYDINLTDKKVVILGRGRLVGAPLKKMLDNSGVKTQVIHSQTKNPNSILKNANVIISAVGKPGILTSFMIPKNCVIVDAATASEGGQIKGDLADDVYQRDDLTITPKIGGVGPLTVCALFDNLIRVTQSKT